ncbi:AAEL000731-PA [Aedes aegypti]|uniref:AAEL000731-PA n=1 Tax=Aedes aegypti TaxID=7159 RepID=Q17NC7_AEDAE|nr:AAEL000731-PA [Aedes aegypti]
MFVDKLLGTRAVIGGCLQGGRLIHRGSSPNRPHNCVKLQLCFINQSYQTRLDRQPITTPTFR